MSVKRLWFPFEPDGSLASPDRMQIGVGYSMAVIPNIFIPVIARQTAIPRVVRETGKAGIVNSTQIPKVVRK